MILTSADISKYIGSSSLSATYDILAPAILQDFVDYTNNDFENHKVGLQGRMFEFSTSGVCTVIGTNFSTWSFAVDDEIRIKGSCRNDDFYTISSITNDTFLISTLQTFKTELRESNVKISKVQFPESAKAIMAQMVKFKIENPLGVVKSESLGDYSVSYGSVNNGYPDGINAAMNKYVNVRFT